MYILPSYYSIKKIINLYDYPINNNFNFNNSHIIFPKYRLTNIDNEISIINGIHKKIEKKQFYIKDDMVKYNNTKITENQKGNLGYIIVDIIVISSIIYISNQF